MPAIKVLIVDDQPLVRKGLQMGLSLEGDITIVGEAENGRTAVDAVDTYHPDVVIMDLEMPEVDGIDATRILKNRYPHLRVIILSIYSTPAIRKRALEAGANAFVEKKEGLEQLLFEIRRMGG